MQNLARHGVWHTDFGDRRKTWHESFGFVGVYSGFAEPEDGNCPVQPQPSEVG